MCPLFEAFTTGIPNKGNSCPPEPKTVVTTSGFSISIISELENEDFKNLNFGYFF